METKKRYKVTIIQEEYLSAYVYADSREEAFDIAGELDYDQFDIGDSDIINLEAEEESE